MLNNLNKYLFRVQISSPIEFPLFKSLTWKEKGEKKDH